MRLKVSPWEFFGALLMVAGALLAVAAVLLFDPPKPSISAAVAIAMIVGGVAITAAGWILLARGKNNLISGLFTEHRRW